jgi:hypothetical protein
MNSRIDYNISLLKEILIKVRNELLNKYNLDDVVVSLAKRSQKHLTIESYVKKSKEFHYFIREMIR